MAQMSKNILLREQCNYIFDSPESFEYGCTLLENNFCCTTIKDNFFDWEVNGIGKNIASLCIFGIMSIIILMACEFGVSDFFKKSTKGNNSLGSNKNKLVN